MRAGNRQSWLTGLGLGLPSAYLLLEFPMIGLGLMLLTVLVMARAGRAAAGTAGLVVGMSPTWLILFGRVWLSCGRGITDRGTCAAPGIEGTIAISLAILAVGAIATIGIAIRSRRA